MIVLQTVTLGQQVHGHTNLDSNLTFKNGQIFFGKINKIYPNQTAEVQIGSQKMLANLEAPLQTAGRYWFQVQSNEGKPILKVIDMPSSSTLNGDGAVQQILSRLGVKGSTEAQGLAAFLLKNQFSITKDSFLLALQWLKNVDSSLTGLEALKTMYVRQLPFVEDVFTALTAQAKGESFHNQLQQLLGKVNTSGTETVTLTQLKGVLEALVSPKQEKIQEIGLGKMLSLWLNPVVSADSKAGAYSLLQKIGLFPAQLSEQEFLTKLVMDSQVGGPPTVKTELATKWQQGIQIVFDINQAMQNGDKKAVNELMQTFSTWVKEQGGTVATKTNAEIQVQSPNDLSKLTMKILETLFNERQSSSKVMGNQNNDFFLGLLNQDGRQISQAKDALINQLMSFSGNRGERVLSNEQAVLQWLETEFQLPDLTKGTVVSTQLRAISNLLGLQFEHVLANAQSLTPTMLEEQITTLKPLLLKLLQEQQPAAIKELAEQIVSRITAQQIISHENGPLQNVLFNLPFQLGNYQTDVTLQWSGRKTKEGAIDPNYCRILFYLDLEKLNETVIDMQVQNRVIKIVVHNEQSELIESVASSYIHVLRANLEQMNYKLSGVIFENNNDKPVTENQKQLVYKVSSSYSGVDIRI